MSQADPDPLVHAPAGDDGWKWLYYTGGAAALIAVLFFRRNFGVELITFGGFGIFEVPAEFPHGALAWFALFQENTLLGLTLFHLIDLVNYALVGLIILALFVALHRASKSAMVIATAAGLIGIAVYFASNQAFAMLSLSSKYAAAATETQRSTYVAAGEALLAMNDPATIHQGTGVHTGLFLVLASGLIISIVMLRSRAFFTLTAWSGILANGLALGHFVALALGLSPILVGIPIIVSAPFRMIWYLLTAIGLLRLARAVPDEADGGFSPRLRSSAG